ncbi:hypothetical protein FOZ60_015364 [Perkinsus olseni]|uniref:RING-type domain-containing protein n=1 Tax=Perkinsus olseni TaxID=32597 RepID=A0A7J6P815_PEROL|nr:hypothetical protein FOZ60_015364 [Perkinsus olseni]
MPMQTLSSHSSWAYYLRYASSTSLMHPALSLPSGPTKKLRRPWSAKFVTTCVLVFKQLPCPHRYCTDCIGQLEQSPGASGSICCPECRVPCDVDLITYDVKSLQKLLERNARCAHFMRGCDWKGPLCHRSFHPCPFEDWAEEMQQQQQQQQLSGGSSGSKAVLTSSIDHTLRPRERPPRPVVVAPKVAPFTCSSGANIVATPSLATAKAARGRPTKGLVPPMRPKTGPRSKASHSSSKAAAPAILNMPQTWQQLTKKQRAQFNAANKAPHPKAAAPKAVTAKAAITTAKAVTAKAATTSTTAKAVTAKAATTTAKAVTAEAATTTTTAKAVTAKAATTTTTAKAVTAEAATSTAKAVTAEAPKAAIGTTALAKAFSAHSAAIQGNASRAAPPNFAATEVRTTEVVPTKLGSIATSAGSVTPQSPRRPLETVQSTASALPAEAARRVQFDTATYDDAFIHPTRAPAESSVQRATLNPNDRLASSSSCPRAGLDGLLPLPSPLHFPVTRTPAESSVRRVKTDFNERLGNCSVCPGAGLDGLLPLPSPPHSSRRVGLQQQPLPAVAGPQSRVLELAGRISANVDPRQESERVALEAVRQRVEEKPCLADCSAAKSAPPKPSRPPRPTALPAQSHRGPDDRLKDVALGSQQGIDGKDGKPASQPSKPTEPPVLLASRSMSSEVDDHEVLARADGSPLGSAQASSPSRLRHSEAEAKAGGGRDSERPSAELESLLEEASKFKKWMDDEGSSLQRGAQQPGLVVAPIRAAMRRWYAFFCVEGKLPLGLHLLPLIDLDDLERMGDLPSLPESFEMAQASVAAPAPAAPSSFLDSGRGGKGNFWETVNLPQDLVAEVMKRMNKHHRQQYWGALGGGSRSSWGLARPFVPFAKAVLVGDLGIDECWRRCTQQYFFCTQTHYAAASQTCYFGHGLSMLLQDDGPPSSGGSDRTRSIGGSLDTCRSLTELGFRELRTSRLHSGFSEALEDDVPNLSPFTVVPGSERYLLVQPSIGIVDREEVDDSAGGRVRMERAETFLQCQSNCLVFDWCAAAVWIDRGPQGSICTKGSMLLPLHEDSPSKRCPVDSRCMEVCGGQDCVPSTRNPAGVSTLSWSYPGEPFNFVVSIDTKSPREMSFGCADSDCVDGIRRCHATCQQAACHSGWAEIVADKAEVRCFLSSSFPIVAGSAEAGSENRGAASPPTMCPKTARACLMFSSDHMMLPRPMQAAQVWLEQSTGDGLEGRSVPQHPVAMGSDIEVLSGWGRCSPFHGGLSASPDSSFVARDRVHAPWCIGMILESQVEYHNSTGVCVLGNGVASRVQRSRNGLRSKAPVFCHSIRNGPSATHGLPGMMIVDRVTGAESAQHWFLGYQSTTLVGTLEECQTLCEKATEEATNAECRYGGFESCRAVRAACRGDAGDAAAGGELEECKMCKNDKGGICRIGSESKPGGSGTSSRCLSGACKWFEMGAVGFRVKAASVTSKYVDHLPINSGGLICPQGGVIDRDVLGRCYHNVESMWHCHALCEAQTGECMGGLYVDGGGGDVGKMCYLAAYLRYHASDYEDVRAQQLCGSSNCAAFMRDGIGKLPTLRATGSLAADQAVEAYPQGAVNMTGICNEFNELDNTMMEGSPADFAYNPEYACSMRCLTMLQCMSFKVEGYPEDVCDLHSHRPNVSAGCETITCRFSSTIPSKATKVEIRPGEYAKNAICVSKGVAAATALSTDSGVHDGLPGFYSVNAMARKFRWADVMNKKRLILTPHLEGCQSVCRGKKQCKTGTWQSCGSLKDVCVGQEVSSLEMNRTCEACTGIVVSEDRAPEDYPTNMGVCKLSSAVSHAMFNCGATAKGGALAGCYSFEKGRNNFVVMSSYASPFIEEDASSRVNTSLIVFEGEKGAYGKVLDLDTCQYFCEKDPLCTYGHFGPRGIGFGDCYLTHSTAVDRIDASTIESRPILQPKGWDVKRCDGVCVVFKKAIPQDEGRAVTDMIDEMIDSEEQEVQPDIGRLREEDKDQEEEEEE